ESLHKQLKAKESKIAKQSERLQAQGIDGNVGAEGQAEELSTARRDREQMRQRLADLEDATKSQPKVASHADAERRLIAQETKMREVDRQAHELKTQAESERQEKDNLIRELSALRGRMAQGASSSGNLETENDRLSKELEEKCGHLEAYAQEVKRLREEKAKEVVAAEWAPAPEAVEKQPGSDFSMVTSLPGLQRKLQRLEETDRNLGREVLYHLQEREAKIESLNSTIALLRATVDDLRERPAQQLAVFPGVDVGVRTDAPTPVGVGIGTEATSTMGVAVGTDGWPVGVGRGVPVGTDAALAGMARAAGPDQPYPAGVDMAINTSVPQSPADMSSMGQYPAGPSQIPPPSPRGQLPPIRRPPSREGSDPAVLAHELQELRRQHAEQRAELESLRAQQQQQEQQKQQQQQQQQRSEPPARSTPALASSAQDPAMLRELQEL
ncbi:unnamed protein product, partial [Polarella glacialis]